MSKETIELKLIENWNDINFNQYKKLLKLAFNKPDDESILEYRLKQANIINPHLDEGTIGKLRLSQLSDYFSQIDFLDNEPIKEVFNKFKIDDKEYSLIDFSQMSLAQWIDSEKFTNDIEDYHQIVALFYISPGEYNDLEREKVAKFIDEQPCSRVFYLLSQFFFIQAASEKALVAYSEQMTKRLTKTERIIQKSKSIQKKLKEVQKKFGLKSSTK